MQDVAHLLSGEKTFQSTYESEDGALGMLFQHTFYLLPLVFEAAKPFLDRVAMLGLAAIPGMLVGMYHSLNSEGGVFPWEFCPARVLHTKLRTKEDLADLATVFCSCSKPLLTTGMFAQPSRVSCEHLVQVRQFAMDSNPSRTTSSHWWYEKAYDMKHSLNETARQAFQVPWFMSSSASLLACSSSRFLGRLGRSLVDAPHLGAARTRAGRILPRAIR